MFYFVSMHKVCAFAPLLFLYMHYMIASSYLFNCSYNVITVSMSPCCGDVILLRSRPPPWSNIENNVYTCIRYFLYCTTHPFSSCHLVVFYQCVPIHSFDYDILYIRSSPVILYVRSVIIQLLLTFTYYDGC